MNDGATNYSVSPFSLTKCKQNMAPIKYSNLNLKWCKNNNKKIAVDTKRMDGCHGQM